MAAGPSGASTTQHTVKACFVEQCEFSQINKLTRLSFCRYFCVRCVPPCFSITKNYCPVAKCCKVPFFLKKRKSTFLSFRLLKKAKQCCFPGEMCTSCFPSLLSSSPGWDGGTHFIKSSVLRLYYIPVLFFLVVKQLTLPFLYRETMFTFELRRSEKTGCAAAHSSDD